MIGVICRRMRTKIVKSHGVSADDNDLDYTPLKSAESAPTSPTEMTTINLVNMSLKYVIVYVTKILKIVDLRTHQ